jgi:hypothetical protein
MYVKDNGQIKRSIMEEIVLDNHQTEEQPTNNWDEKGHLESTDNNTKQHNTTQKKQ